MKVKDEIFHILRQNYLLRVEISDKIDTREVNVYRWSTRKSIPSWYEDEVISVIMQELQLSKDKIVETN